MKMYIYTLSDPISKEIKYIGQTKDLKDRLSRHMTPSNLKNLWTPKTKWLKYLKNNNLKPIMDMLDIGETDNIDDLEIYWISQFKTWGFNLKNVTIGGQNKIIQKGEKLKKHHIDALKRNHPNKKPVIQYTLDDVFVDEYESIAGAERQTGLSHIGSCCQNKRKSSGGYYFRYKNNYFPYNSNRQESKKVCQYSLNNDFIKMYESLHDAARKTLFTRSHILRCCQGKTNNNSVHGYYFRFKDNYFNYTIPINKSLPIKVFKYDLNDNLIKEYESYNSAYKEGFARPSIKKVLDKNLPYKNFIWKSEK